MGEAQETFRALQSDIEKYHKDLKKATKGKAKHKALEKAKKVIVKSHPDSGSHLMRVVEGGPGYKKFKGFSIDKTR